MTTQQLITADALSRKIARNEAILKGLQKSNMSNDEQKKPFVLVRFLYYPEGETVHEVLIDPEWFHSSELRSDFQHCINIAKEGFVELLEKDLQLMREELGKLK